MNLSTAYILPTADRIREVFRGLRAREVDQDSVPLKPAGVLVPLYGEGKDLGVVLTMRTRKVEHHKGEVSFPGGAYDPEDESLMQTALREAYEEVGIHPDDVSLVGQVDDLATRTGFLIRPYVGLIPADYDFKPSATEVEKVLTIPISHLVDPANVTVIVGAPAYAYEETVVWGATARILTQVLALVLRGAQRLTLP